jgi:hypothetical protein
MFFEPWRLSCALIGMPYRRERRVRAKKGLGVYLKKMRDTKVGAAKVLAILQQIKDLHRNPLAHPDETLTLEEAVGLFGIVQSAINAMLKDIPMPKPAPIAGVGAIPPTTPSPSPS